MSLRENIIYTSFGECGVIFNLDDRKLHELNQTGILVLDLLDGKKNVGELIRTFSLKCGWQEDSVRRDVMGFLEDFAEREWVDVR